MEKENLLMRKCPRFISCNAPLCLLDIYIKERVGLLEDERCPALIKSRRKEEKGSRYGQIRKAILELKT